MCYVIAGGDEKNPLYLTGITQSGLADWELDGAGHIVRMIPPKKSYKAQVIGNYLPDVSKARKFRTAEKAREMIEENPVLRYCRVVEVKG